MEAEQRKKTDASKAPERFPYARLHRLRRTCHAICGTSNNTSSLGFHSAKVKNNNYKVAVFASISSEVNVFYSTVKRKRNFRHYVRNKKERSKVKKMEDI